MFVVHAVNVIHGGADGRTVVPWNFFLFNVLEVY